MNDSPAVSEAMAPVSKNDPADPQYKSRIVDSSNELVIRAFKLRYDVFHREMGEGTESSFGLDNDPFDHVCKHVIVEDRTGAVVGTYRMQTGLNAYDQLGYYSASQFHMEPFEPIRPKIIELGRACVHKDHRNRAVLSRLWSTIADFARQNGAWYLIGCSSIHGTDPKKGAALFRRLLGSHLVDLQFRTLPLPPGACPVGDEGSEGQTEKIPPLFATYLSIGAKVCGPPFIDLSFGTTDFLTFFDFEHARDDVKRKYLGMK